MNLIECYEPEFVRQYCKNHPEQQPIDISWQHEIRRSLLLDDYARCEAILSHADAFSLHTHQQEQNMDHPVLSRRMQILNQATLDIITLPDVAIEIRLYAIGIMLSYAEKLPGESDDVLQKIAELPQQTKRYAELGILQEMYLKLPSLPQFQCNLITELSDSDFDWSLLPESVRKNTFPLQLSLLVLQDTDSIVSLQQQLFNEWQSHGVKHFSKTPWVMNNYLIYRIYHDVFPHDNENNIIQNYLSLIVDYFLLRTMLSFWMTEASLSHEETLAFFALYERWRNSTQGLEQRQQLGKKILQGDHLLSAFSLLNK